MKNCCLVILGTICAMMFACDSSHPPNSYSSPAAPSPSVTLNATSSPSVSLKPKTESIPTDEKQFSFPAQGGKEVTAYYKPYPKDSGKKVVIFDPIEGTDGNFYNASLHALWSIYGKERGLFQLDDLKKEYDSSLGGNRICWEVSNPKQDFCVFPIRDSDTGNLGGMIVWIK